MHARFTGRVSTVLLLAGVALLSSPAAIPSSAHRSLGIAASPAHATVHRAFSKLPLSFEVNRGQAANGVGFVAHAAGYTAFLSSLGADLSLHRLSAPAATPSAGFRLLSHTRSSAPSVQASHLSLRFIGANPRARPFGLGRLPGVVNYFMGRDPRGWHTDIPTYSRIGYQGLYHGIDLVYYGRGSQLEYDWIVHPGARLSVIRFALSGTSRALLDRSGSLHLHTSIGDFVQYAPRAYQLTGAAKTAVSLHYVGRPGSTFGLRSSGFDAQRTLVVDPVVTYASYLGGSLADTGKGITVDATGDMFVAGITASTDFPVRNPFQTSRPDPTGHAPPHAFVTKLNPAGNAVLFSTYLGGANYDEAFAVRQDATGVYVAGDTGSSDFPTLKAFQGTFSGGADAFIVKLTPTGDGLIYSSLLGADGEYRAYGLAIDPSKYAYITGDAVPPFRGGGSNATPNLPHAFVARIAPDGALTYKLVLQGNFAETAGGIAADAAGDAFVVGSTRSSDFPSNQTPTPGVIGDTDGYVLKLDPTGKNVLYSTHLGGSSELSIADAVALDSEGNAYVSGQTAVADFPVVGGFQTTYGGNSSNSFFPGDAFVAKIDQFGRIRYSTYLGGARDEEALSIAVDHNRAIYVTGWTDSADFPVKEAVQPAFTGAICGYDFGIYPCTDAFVTAINPSGTLKWSTFIGGSNTDFGNSIAVSPTGKVYVAGTTGSVDLSTVKGYEPRGKGTDLNFLHAFIVELSPGTPPVNRSLVVDAIRLYHRVAGRMVLTGKVHVGETLRVVAIYHDRRGNAGDTLGTLVILRSGREIQQGYLQPGTSRHKPNVHTTLQIRPPAYIGRLTARVAVISNGLTAQRDISFQLVR